MIGDPSILIYDDTHAKIQHFCVFTSHVSVAKSSKITQIPFFFLKVNKTSDNKSKEKGFLLGK